MQHQQRPALRMLLLLGAALGILLAFRSIFGSQRARDAGMYVRVGQQRHGAMQDAYTEAAIANITKYRNQLLSHIIPYFKQNGTYPGDGFKDKDWEVFKPIISCPPDRPLTKYGGEGDGSKFLCNLGRLAQQEGCVIYSLGSNGDFKFEQDMLKQTKCEIHTMDCTYDGKSLGPRHTYHKWCVGSASSGPKFYRTWSNITSSLGHDRVDLLKMDVDGYEYGVLADFQPEGVLPDHISIEIHIMIRVLSSMRPWLQKWLAKLPHRVPHTLPALALVFMHLANLGYGVYSLDSNTGAPACCSEFTFLRVPGALATAQGSS